MPRDDTSAGNDAETKREAERADAKTAPPEDHGATGPEIGLVLSGGGARCFAQVGALAAFEERGVRIRAIAANSSAAILAAMYAAGMDAAELYAVVRDINFSRFIDPRGAGGLIGHSGVEELLRPHVPETFEELRIPCAFPAVDIQTAEMLVFTSGPLIPAACASNAFPGLFVPVEFNGRYLMDGGILNNVPVDLVRTMVTLPAWVVDVRPLPTELLVLPPADAPWWERVRTSVTGAVPLTLNILMKAYLITQSRLIELRYTMHPPDLVIAPPLGDDFKTQDFSRCEDGYEIGYEATHRALDEQGLP